MCLHRVDLSRIFLLASRQNDDRVLHAHPTQRQRKGAACKLAAARRRRREPGQRCSTFAQNKIWLCLQSGLLQRKPLLITTDGGYNLYAAIVADVRDAPGHIPRMIHRLLAADADPNTAATHALAPGAEPRHPLLIAGIDQPLLETLFDYGVLPPPTCALAVQLAYDYWRDAHTRVRRVRIAKTRCCAPSPLSMGYQSWALRYASFQAWLMIVIMPPSIR